MYQVNKETYLINHINRNTLNYGGGIDDLCELMRHYFYTIE